MKITEVTKPSTNEIFESIKADKDHSFSEDTMQAIAESISKATTDEQPMTLEQALTVIDSL